jgi:hypothetical protein
LPEGAAPPQAYPAPAYPPPVSAYPAPDRPAPPAPQPPNDAAVRTSPWIDVMVATFAWSDRISEFMNIGVQAGGYIAKRVRISGRLLLPTSDAKDDFRLSTADVLDGDGYVYEESEPARLLYGANLGVVAAGTRSFVLSPGLMFLRSDVADYGTMVGLSLPFEWVTPTGLRVGFEFALGRALGGDVRQSCTSSGLPGQCADGPTRTVRRDPGTGILLDFEIGWGFNHPGVEAASP